jgi:hypothetical protein
MTAITKNGWKLIRHDGSTVCVNDRAPDFRGEPCIIRGGTPPHKPSSTGHILTDAGEYYPSVCGLRWVSEIDLDLIFKPSDLAFAKEFAMKANIGDLGEAQIIDGQYSDDSIQLGCFTITKVEDVKVRHSILGDEVTPCVSYVITVEQQEYEHDTGWQCDEAEIAREDSFWAALRECALAEKRWAIENIIDSMALTQQLTQEH